MVTARDISGQRFGRLTAIRLDGHINAKRAWLCVCTCGSETRAAQSDITSGKRVSCGCQKAEKIGALRRAHGMSNTPEYVAWLNMKARCREDHERSKDYASRGISVCKRWEVFSAFLSDMGPRPSPTHSIDRIDNDKGYSPTNCRWATPSQQAQNQRRSVRPRNSHGQFSKN